MLYKSLPGVFDILPHDEKELWKSSYLWEWVENKFREIAKVYGYREIRTPLFEKTELFQRSVGSETDIVSKEMYTFEDRGGRLISLRPEGTAPVMRALIEHHLNQSSSIQKYFYIFPMFRYERSQSGRYRQHHQFGIEAIGNPNPEQDVEVIDLLYSFYLQLGLKDLQVNLNSIGFPEERELFRNALKDYLYGSADQLSNDSKQRLETNPLRILDSKDENDQLILKKSPQIIDFLGKDSLDHLETVKTLLGQLNIPFMINPFLVRGLDYYNQIVFEVTATELGAQNSIGGGGRYDGLLKALGGPDLPAFGFGSGIERVLQTMIKQNAPLPNSPCPLVYLISLGDDAKSYCFSLVHKLRVAGIASEMELGGKKLGKAMQLANSSKAKFVAVIGEEELKQQNVELKEMTSGNKFNVPLHQLQNFLTTHK